MTMRALALPADVSGRLWLTAMPGRLEPWPTFLAEAARKKLDLLVCLTPLHEIGSYSRDYAEAVAQQSLPFAWLNLPMRDYGLSTNTADFESGIGSIAAALQAGQCVALHCAAGVGRTGTAAACVLKRLGASRDEAVERVRLAGSSPQSALQSGLIDRF